MSSHVSFQHQTLNNVCATYSVHQDATVCVLVMPMVVVYVNADALHHHHQIVKRQYHVQQVVRLYVFEMPVEHAHVNAYAVDVYMTMHTTRSTTDMIMYVIENDRFILEPSMAS